MCLTLDYDYMYSEKDFTQEKSHFHPTSLIPDPSSCHGYGWIAEKWRRKGHEKCIFETPHNEIKCVLSIKELNFNDKRIKIFTSGLTPPPLTISLAEKYMFFYASPNEK